VRQYRLAIPLFTCDNYFESKYVLDSLRREGKHEQFGVCGFAAVIRHLMRGRIEQTNQKVLTERRE
jgi:hypothetical protein